jgi:hypothetical protein
MKDRQIDSQNERRKERARDGHKDEEETFAAFSFFVSVLCYVDKHKSFE